MGKRATRVGGPAGTNVDLGSYYPMANADHYRENAQQCCLNAVMAQDICHSTH
jgi:hypothetical protein